MTLRVGGGHRLAGAVPAQVEVEMAVGITLGQLVSGMDGQGGLADAAHAGDGDQADDRSAVTGRIPKHRKDCVDLGGAAGEVRSGRRQLPRGRSLVGGGLLRRCPWSAELAAGNGEELVGFGGCEGEGRGEGADGVDAGAAAGAAFQDADCLLAEACLLGEGGLGEAGADAEGTEELAQRWRRRLAQRAHPPRIQARYRSVPETSGPNSRGIRRRPSAVVHSILREGHQMPNDRLKDSIQYSGEDSPNTRPLL